MTNTDDLLAGFCQNVQHPQMSGFEVLELLDIRSALARREEELNDWQRRTLEEADEVFLRHAAQFHESIMQIANLTEMRKLAMVPPSHWWWYLEKLMLPERAAL